MDSDKLVKTGVLQVAISDEEARNRNGKLSNPPSLISSTYCHFFHTLLILSQELTFTLKPVTELNFHPTFSILINYLCPPSTHMFRNNPLLAENLEAH